MPDSDYNVPFLFWPCFYYPPAGKDGCHIWENRQCPSFEYIKISLALWNSFKNDPYKIYCSETFRDFFVKHNSIQIIDKHFGLNSLIWLMSILDNLPEFSNLENIIIFYAWTNEHKKMKAKKEKSNSGQKYISLFPINMDIIHDRFMICDDQIWHFGGSIGGLQPGLTAVSGPWPDLQGSMQGLVQVLQDTFYQCKPF